MELTNEEKQIVRRIGLELGRRMAAAAVPEERWTLVTLAVVSDLSRQALSLQEPAQTPAGGESWQR